MGRIQDRNVREAVELVAHEFESLEDVCNELAEDKKALENENSALHDEVEDLKEKVKELEDALADACLTGDVDGRESTTD